MAKDVKKAAPRKVSAASAPRKATPVKKAAAPAKKAATPKKGNGGLDGLTQAQQDAYYLSEAAIMLDQARKGAKRDAKKLAAALENELEVWTAIRTVVNTWTDGGREQSRQNLCRLSDFIAGTIMSSGVEISDAALDTMININLQISEGLLEGDLNKHVREEAYRRWEAAGCPHGQDQHYWFEAERDLRQGK